MIDWILQNEPLVRLSAFGGIFALMTIWEFAAPRRERRQTRRFRWWSNIGVSVLDTVAVRLLIPLTAVALAEVADDRAWGLFNTLEVWPWVAVVVSFVVLDMVIWVQHVVFHAIPILWRVHRMHHADIDLDVTSGVRFHPIEILLSMLIKFAAVLLLGAPAAAVLIFEVALNATSMFNHSNVNIPRPLDRVVRWLVVTPDMHRVHHSVEPHETNSNFGFNFPWWDRLFGTYRAQPEAGHDGMTLGLEDRQDPGENRLDKMLIHPFQPLAGRYDLPSRTHERPTDSE